MGITNKAVGKRETGEAFPETGQLLPLASIPGVTVDELLKGERIARENDPQNAVYEERAERFRPRSRKLLFAFMTGLGVMPIFAGIISIVTLAPADADAMTGVYVLLSCIGTAAFVFVTFGICNEKLRHPVKDPPEKPRRRLRADGCVGHPSLVCRRHADFRRRRKPCRGLPSALWRLQASSYSAGLSSKALQGSGRGGISDRKS